MNLRAIANNIASSVNPNEIVTVLISTGFTAGAGARQVPSYATPASGSAQIQALDNDDLKQMSGLNVQGTISAIYLYGELAGVVRPKQKGGDIIQRGDPVQNWLVVKVLETWPHWTKAAIVLQS